MFILLFLLLCNLGISLTPEGIVFQHYGDFSADIEASTISGKVSLHQRFSSAGEYVLQVSGIRAASVRAFPECEDISIGNNVLLFPEQASEKVINGSQNRKVYSSNESRQYLIFVFCFGLGLLVWHEKNQLRCKDHS